MSIAICADCGRRADESRMSRYCIFALEHTPFLCDECYEMTQEKIVLGKGKLYFGDRLLGETVEGIDCGAVPARLMRERKSSFPQVVMSFKLNSEKFVKGMKDATRQLKIYSDGAYFSNWTAKGYRLALLMHSTDPRQRKRGRTLYRKVFGHYPQKWGLNLHWPVDEVYTPEAAAEMTGRYREAYPTLRDFWETNLGKVYEPSRYKKD